MKKTILLLFSVAGMLAAIAQPAFHGPSEAGRPLSMDELTAADLQFATRQYKVLMQHSPAGKMPRTFDAAKNQVLTSDIHWWCSGFYPGTLWYLYEYDGDTAIRSEAVRRLHQLSEERYNTHDHDLGFKMFCSFGNAWRITRDTAWLSPILTAAQSLASRYRPSIHSIQSWDSNSRFKCPVIIDNMMNLELLEWASQNGGGKRPDSIAVNHANTTLKNHLRPDFSSFHVVDYNLATGGVRKRVTWQGYSDSSSWSRGQGWALYGYTMMYRFTGDSIYLNSARGIARFIMRHPNLPADGVPYWDFDAPGIPNALRDVSAASVIASALLELGQYSSGADRSMYVRLSEKIIRSLSAAPYIADAGGNGGFLLQHSVGALPLKVEVDVPLSYADYYFVEALMRYRKWYL